MINFKKKNNRKMSGFTLVETLVALFIFSVSILSVMAALSQGIKSTSYAKNKILAQYLSQEGLEYFRNMRDTHILYETGTSKIGWATFVSKLMTTGRCQIGCTFNNNELAFGTDIKNIYVEPCNSGTCGFLYYDSSHGNYNLFSGGSATTFSRTMLVKQVGSDNLEITSKVTWGSGSGAGTISLSENLSSLAEN